MQQLPGLGVEDRDVALVWGLIAYVTAGYGNNVTAELL
jgi:hypothetical protein